MACLTERKAYACELMEKLGFPEDAKKAFSEALDRIAEDKTVAAGFSHLLEQYDESKDCAYEQMIAEAKALGEALGIHEYAISMLLFLCMAEKLKERYAEQGIAEEIYYNSIADLRYKLEECRLVFGIDGTFVAPWYFGFFDMTRFALGRLQFEIMQTPADYTFGDMQFPAGSKVINLHIPRTGEKLCHADVLDSYKMAAEWFAPEFAQQPMVFVCRSWMLDPWNMTVLLPDSNLAAFYNDYRVIQTGVFEGHGDVWRIFDKMYTGDVSKLPQDTSLRKAYAERIASGEPTCWGLGVFIWHNGMIVN